MAPLLYWFLLLFTCGFAIYRGGRYERGAAAVCLAGSLLTLLFHRILSVEYFDLKAGDLLIDVGVLFAFLAIALQSDRFWPLWVTGLQLTTLVAHFLKLIDPALVPVAYAAAARMWSYPILLIIALGVLRAWQRSKRERLRT